MDGVDIKHGLVGTDLQTRAAKAAAAWLQQQQQPSKQLSAAAAATFSRIDRKDQ